MTYKIKSDSAFEVCRLEIGDSSCTYTKGTVSASKTKLHYNEVDAILMSDEKVLSIHHKGKTFAIPTKEKDQVGVRYLADQVKLARVGGRL